MSITRRLHIAFTVMVALVVLAAITAAAAITVVTRSEQSKSDQIARILGNTAELRVNISSEIDALRAELLMRATGAQISGDLSTYMPRTKELISQLRKDSADAPQILSTLKEIETRAANFDKVAQETLEQARDGSVTQAEYDSSSKVEPVLTVLNGNLLRLAVDVGNYRSRQSSEIRSTSLTALIIVLAVLAGVIVICVYMAVRYPRMIGAKLRGAVARLRETIANLQSAAEQLAGAAVETATAVRQTAVTAEQVERASRVTTEKAAVVATGAKDDVDSLTSALQASAATVAGMTEIKGQMANVASSVDELTEQLQSASQVIDTSSDIAEQSNVLAVNAAIEAAKAAEHSKGFGVVADEMHSLANQSKAAVVQVRQIIDEIRKAAAKVVDAAEATNESVTQGMQQVADSEVAMKSVVKGATGAQEGMTHISAAASQQLAGVEQIVESFSSIDVATSQIAGSARHVRERATELRELAEELQAMAAARQESATEAEPEPMAGPEPVAGPEPDVAKAPAEA